jgi:hypothetical protein
MRRPRLQSSPCEASFQRPFPQRHARLSTCVFPRCKDGSLLGCFLKECSAPLPAAYKPRPAPGPTSATYLQDGTPDNLLDLFLSWVNVLRDAHRFCGCDAQFIRSAAWDVMKDSRSVDDRRLDRFVSLGSCYTMAACTFRERQKISTIIGGIIG